MLVSRLNWAAAKRLIAPLNWTASTPETARTLWRLDRYVVKLWLPRYESHKLVVADGNFVLHDFFHPLMGIACLDIGLVCSDTAPGFVDTVEDEAGSCIGYLTVAGERIDALPQDFVERVWRATLSTGYAHTDLCANNAVEVDGQVTLIDLDTPPTLLSHFDVAFEMQHGSLRSHVDERYRLLLRQHLRDL